MRLAAAGFLAASLHTYSAEKSISELEREANDVLSDPDNVSRRKRISPVFELAARYAAAGQTNKALSYYGKALEHEPWNLDAQLAFAQLLYATGDTNVARQKAETVWTHAETDSLLMRAARMLGQSFDALPGGEPWPGNGTALALVPVGEVDAWLLRDLRAELPKLLSIPVIIQQLPVTIPKPGRDTLHLRADELRDRFAKAHNDPEFRALLKKLKMTTNSLANDQQVFALTEAILNASADKDPLRRFREDLSFLRRLGPQWDAGQIVANMARTFPAQPGSTKGYLGVTTLDLYSNESRYVFGTAGLGANCGIFSYRRYTSALVEEPPNRERLKQRSLKQALSSTGLLFGLPRCTDPTCARAYAHDLAEHDAKQLRLCSQCQRGFAERFSR